MAQQSSGEFASADRGEGSERCKASRAPGQRKDFSPFTQPCPTLLMSNATLFRPTHRTFRAAAIGHSVKRLLWREQGVPGDLLRPSFGNVAVPAQILPCIDVELNRGVAHRQFKNTFPRGNEVSRALVSFEHPDRRE
jgi:hypothetical protein